MAFELTVVAKPSVEWYSYLKSLSVRERIAFKLLSRISDVQLFNEYKSTHLFVEATAYDWFNFPPLEAMAFGIPVVYAFAIRDVGIWRDAAFVCSFDPLSIAGAIEKSLVDTQSRELHIKAGYLLCKRTTMKQTAAAITDIVREAM